jgi:hypothetical protein
MELIDLSKCIFEKEYEIVMTCDIPRFYEIGIYATQKIKVLARQGGMYRIRIDNTSWMIREEQARCIKVKEIKL